MKHNRWLHVEHQKGRSSEVFEIVSLVSQKAVVLFTDFFFQKKEQIWEQR